MEPLKRLKYVSEFARELSEAEIDALVADAAHRNEALGITGILTTAGRLFFQIIEGPRERVDGLFRQIVADDRHKNILLVSTADGVPHRLFPDWAMKRIDPQGEGLERVGHLHDVLEVLVEMRRTMDRLTTLLETSIWRELRL